jgi:hypothetical protein
MDPNPAPREQEQIIKAKKQQLFEADEPVAGPLKPFAQYVRETPAAPLSVGVKALLWGAGVVVVLILLYALIRGPRPRARPAPRADRAAIPSARVL